MTFDYVRHAAIRLVFVTSADVLRLLGLTHLCRIIAWQAFPLFTIYSKHTRIMVFPKFGWWDVGLYTFSILCPCSIAIQQAFVTINATFYKHPVLERDRR